jgi:hypothetical protein
MYHVTLTLMTHLNFIVTISVTFVAEALLIVNVVDVNDERPRFQLDMYTFYVPENRPPGTHVGTVSATDADSPPFNQFTFSVLSAGSLSDAFQMDATSGKLSTTRPLDRERQV